MTPIARCVASLPLLLVLAACGSDGGGGGTSPSKTLRSVSLSAGTTVKVGQSETFTATATYSDNSTTTVSPAWSSDNVSVLTVDVTGKAKGLSSGLATIIATFEGRTATRLLHVVPDYQGTWEGDYTVNRCDVSGDFKGVGLCDGSDPIRVGDLLPVQISMAQSGTQLSGTFAVGSFTGPLTGSIDDGGTFNGTASLTFTAEGLTFTTAVSPLTLRAEGERMTGNFRAESTVPGVSGTWVLGGDLKSVPRTGSATTALGYERQAFGTIPEMVAALRRR